MVNVSEFNKDGGDVAYFLNRVQANDELYLQQKTDSTRYGRYKVVSWADQGVWRAFTVTPIANAGAIPAGNADVALAITVP